MKTPWRWWRERQAKKARDKMRNGFYRTAESFRCLADAMAEVTKGYKSLNLIKMDNLLNSNGRRFRCKIAGTPVEGKIRVEGDYAYLCQDKKSGTDCTDKLGYKYSWIVHTGSASALDLNLVTDFQLLPMTAAEIEAYKDWQVGDKINCDGILREVIFRSGELVVCKELNDMGFWKKGYASANYTCDELYNKGYRLVAEPVEEEEVVEVTMDEIAEKMGVPVERLRVKKEE